MTKQKMIIIIIISITTVLIFSNLSKQAFAFGSSPTKSSNPQPVSPPVFYFPPPPGFPHEWFTNDVLESIKEKGLQIEDIEITTKEDYSSFPASANEGIKFTIPLIEEGKEGYILSFKKKIDIEAVQEHFLKLNEKGELYTWSFVKDNILLILSGTLQEVKARKYEQALYDLK
jgi:hypothetical protein